MRRLLPILLILLLCTSGSLWAESTVWYHSNSIGQITAALASDEGREGYILSSSETGDTSTIQLFEDELLLWTETVEIDGVHRYIKRIDPAGDVIFASHYINNRLASQSQFIDDIFEEETYIYDTDGQLSSIVRQREGSEEHTLFFVDAKGRLEGLIVYDGAFPDCELDHTLLFTSNRESFAIGDEDFFTITVTDDDVQYTYSYQGGVLHQSEELSYADDQKQVVSSHLINGTTVETIYDLETDKILEEILTSGNPEEDYHLINVYDAEGILSTRVIDNSEGVTEYRYAKDVDSNRTVEVRRNGVLHKIITYLEGSRIERVYLEGIFYATITYSEDNEIIEVVHE